jgi:hypothetical protein
VGQLRLGLQLLGCLRAAAAVRGQRSPVCGTTAAPAPRKFVQAGAAVKPGATDHPLRKHASC